uniref:Uncharacterized protein n=1 Tax=Ditylenchus dipsaci TaxID=166011 RepID=A0A915D488_9BILA
MDLKPQCGAGCGCPATNLAGYKQRYFPLTRKQSFGDIISIGSYYKLCMDTFGPPITSDYIEKQVAKAQQFFGNPSDYNVSNVILPNGAFDPWSVLGTSVSIPDQHQIAIMTPGAAHCSDMYAAYDGEPIRLSETRKRVMEEVNYYLRSGLETQKTNSDSFNGAETLTYSKTITGVVLFLLITIIN